MLYLAPHSVSWQVLEDMHQAQVTPDIITYNALLGACTRRADWQTAMAWLDELSDAPRLNFLWAVDGRGLVYRCLIRTSLSIILFLQFNLLLP